jgi:hypothetical protein
METAKLKKFAQYARRSLMEQVAGRMKVVLASGSAARRENAAAVAMLEEQIRRMGREQVVERVAYVWFNRFCALRYMDVHGLLRIGVLSPLPGQFQPEILAEAKAGHIDEELVSPDVRGKVADLLAGKSPSSDAQGEAYRLLVVGVCNGLHSAMPFLFEKIADYTELLMPEDLLSGNSILAYTREAMTPAACEDVEVIGWLYQFYISEKKDEVFNGLKKNKKITPENIPAATQLFTPHWIVRYLVENSLGRLWLLNRPGSKLAGQMEYYIKPEPQMDANGRKFEEDSNSQTIRVDSRPFAVEEFLKVDSPEEIRVCDPACGSGHMLTYAFDLLYAIYEEEGYAPSEIPEKILRHNLTGIEIDERAGELAAFALVMKACQRKKRFLRLPVQPNIVVLKNVDLSADARTPAEADLFHNPGKSPDEEWKLILKAMEGAGIPREDLLHDLNLFKEADNFGSLLRPRLKPEQARKALAALEAYDSSVMAPGFTHRRLVDDSTTALRQSEILGGVYHVVVANPPYMGGKGMNGRMAVWAKRFYPDSKNDLFAMFIERGLDLIIAYGSSAMVTMESWMFLSSYEKLRSILFDNSKLECMIHMPYIGKGGTSMGINFGTCASVINKSKSPNYRGKFCCLRYFETDNDGVPLTFPPKNERLSEASSLDFRKIPGSPVAYWVSKKELDLYSMGHVLNEIAYPRKGLDTGENDQFLRFWQEVSLKKTSFDQNNKTGKWFPYNKGGDFRKWYGNREYLINWEHDGEKIKSRLDWKVKKPTIRNAPFYFRAGYTWTTVSSGGFSARYSPEGSLFDNGGCTLFSDSNLDVIGSFLNTKIMSRYLEFLSPTLNFQPGDIGRALFLPDCLKLKIKSTESVFHTKADWDNYETSWDFSDYPLLRTESPWPVSDGRKELEDVFRPTENRPIKGKTLEESWKNWRAFSEAATARMKELEEENNRIFIDAYGLRDELDPDVPLKEITLTCNPWYRFSSDDKSAEELWTLMREETMKEFISYAVGCMFGRYSLDKPGLILANQGETFRDYVAKVGGQRVEGRGQERGQRVEGRGQGNTEDDGQELSPLTSDLSTTSDLSFLPDEQNVIPVLEKDWFTDDITERFYEFLRVTFGREHFNENLAFLEEALGKDVRKYFLKDFFNDHVKRYKKRPIYWLFTSPKGGFQALIYMHRYRPDTVSVILNDYVREYRAKLAARVEHLQGVEASGDAAKGAKTKAIKEIESLRKIIDELDTWEREVLYPLASERKEIDLDDGVKVNYPKFDGAVKKIAGLEAQDD